MRVAKLLIFLSLFHSLYADWNEDLDATNARLQFFFPDLNTGECKQIYKKFAKSRELLLQDESLVSTMRSAGDKDKFMIMRDSFVCKKRTGANIKEFYAWELARLLGDRQCVVPSFPVEVGDKRVIIQHLESFAFGEETLSAPPVEFLKKVSLETYWKAHFIAYILGFSDLSGRNIGVNGSGQIRFFDNEASFRYVLNPKKPFSFRFATHSFEWPQYRKPLTRAVVFKLKKFIEGFDGFEKKLSVYCAVRRFSIVQDDLRRRLRQVRFFPLKEGATFCDFYKFAFPLFGGDSLDALAHIVGGILGREVGHGSALAFTMSRNVEGKTTREQFEEIRRWMDVHVD